jgi:hypothetical protein
MSGDIPLLQIYAFLAWSITNISRTFAPSFMWEQFIPTHNYRRFWRRKVLCLMQLCSYIVYKIRNVIYYCKGFTVFKGISICRILYTNADAMFLSLTACNNVTSVQVDLYQGGTLSEPDEFWAGYGTLRHNPGVPLHFRSSENRFHFFHFIQHKFCLFLRKMKTKMSTDGSILR